METNTKLGNLSVPLIVVVVVGTSTPTQIVVAIAQAQSNEEDEAKNLISSLRKLIEKKKLVKSLDNILTTVLDKMEKVVSRVDTLVDIQ